MTFLRLSTLLHLVLVVFVTAVEAAGNWPQFRGPDSSGIADDQVPPAQVGPGTNALWQTSTPPGASSPCVWGDRIFLTALDDGELVTLCLDRSGGGTLWRRVAPAEQLEAYHAAEGSPAASTTATDGERVVTYFASYGLQCHDFSGKELWKLSLPIPRQMGDFGSGGSPIISGHLVLLNRDQMIGSELLAIDIRSGQVAWRTSRDELKSGWSTPVVWRQNGEVEIVLAGMLQLRSYDLEDGRERWRIYGLPTAVCTTPVVGDGLLFFAGWSPGKSDSPMPPFDGILSNLDKDEDNRIAWHEADASMQSFFASYDHDGDRFITRVEWETVRDLLNRGENVLLAVRPGGQGDVTETHVAWKQTRGLPYVPSPLYYRGRVYLVKDGGMMSCFDAKTGEPVYQQERLGAIGNYYASPIAAGGRLYVASVNGVLSVVSAGDSPDVLSRAEFDERLVATPAIADNKLYVRTQSRLWAFGQ